MEELHWVQQPRSSRAVVGSRLVIRNHATPELTQEVTIVAKGQTDATKMELGLDTPMAVGLRGHRAGDEVGVRLPNGQTRTYSIISVD